MSITIIVNIVLLVITAFLAFRVLKMSGRNKQNQKMLAILDSFDDRETFFRDADAFIAEHDGEEFCHKVCVLRLWGDAFYERDEEFKAHLSELNIDGLLNPDGKGKGYDVNEDSFFYLYLAIPNRLYYRKRDDLRSMIYEKMSAYDTVNENALLRLINLENRKFYDNKEDRGKAYIRSLLDGEYGGYKYSRQLIGLYKHCEEAILAVILRDEGNNEGYEECMSNIDNFAKTTRLGKRWCKELGIEIPEEETEDTAEETAEETADETPAETQETETEESEQDKA
jgi:hypothetical protein